MRYSPIALMLLLRLAHSLRERRQLLEAGQCKAWWFQLAQKAILSDYLVLRDLGYGGDALAIMQRDKALSSRVEVVR